MPPAFMNGWRRLGLALFAGWVMGAVGVVAYESWTIAGFDIRTKTLVVGAVAIPLALWVAVEFAYLGLRWVLRAFRSRAS